MSQLDLKCGAHVDTWHDAIGGKSNGWWIKWIRNPMSQLELDSNYHPGKANVVADALSRKSVQIL